MPYLSYPFAVLPFVCALLVYALFGSPTPDSYHWPEFLVGALLLASIRMPDWKEDGFLLIGAIYGVGFASLVGVMRGADFSDMFRDIIPFLFLFMILPFRSVATQCRESLIPLVVVMGVIFSLRSLWAGRHIFLFEGGRLSGLGAPPDLLYLANSPEVLFSAVWLFGSGFWMVFYSRQWRVGLFFLIAGLAPFLAMVMMMQRAGIAAVFLVLCIGMARLLKKSPYRFFIALVLGGIGIGCLWPWLGALIEALMWKTHVVGLNSRWQEWEKVLSLISESWWAALFGLGWGARLENPAVGNLSVLYTHSLFSSLLLKTGFVGLTVIFVSFIVPLKKAFPVLARYPWLFWAVLLPVLISGGLYASYKSLGFGLILLVFLLYSHQKLEKNTGFVS